MLVIVGKATPNKKWGYVELFLEEFRNMMRMQGRFVYAWSFNPDERAINTIQQYLDNDEVFIYLPGKDGHSQVRMHVINIRLASKCPTEWQSYCIADLLDYPNRRIWFLIDNIEEDLVPPVDLLNTFTPVFPDKYQRWGQNSFAFLRDK